MISLIGAPRVDAFHPDDALPPLRVFVPLAVILGIVAVLDILIRIIRTHGKLHVAPSDVVLFVGAAVILAIGLLADLIVAQKRQ